MAGATTGIFAIAEPSVLDSAAPKGNVRPSYATIHARPLPLTVYPLPRLIPHNPLSYIHLAFSFIKQVFFTPSSHRTEPYRGYFSVLTRSVHVTETQSIRGLWDSGFFGKGILSRSEPSWLHREKRRLGIAVEETAEEVTARRRAERKLFKAERARKEREEIERQHQAGITAPLDNAEPLADADERDKILLCEAQQETAQMQSLSQQGAIPVSKANGHAATSEDHALIDQEHLQLELIEAFFLVYALGVLDVYSENSEKMSALELLHLCLAHSHFPPLQLPLIASQPAPDDPFFISYAAYHHFRSLGWVVRSGVKFGADLLLYNRGPVFSHAEFAVIVVPSYDHPYWSSNEIVHAYARPAEARKPWRWLHMVNRVQTQVRKTLVVCFVSIPPSHGPELYDVVEGDIGKVLKRYKVREITVKRWVPNRSRD